MSFSLNDDWRECCGDAGRVFILAPADGYSAVGGGTGCAGSRWISSLSSLPGLKQGTDRGGTSTRLPVFGLRPLRGPRCRIADSVCPRWSESSRTGRTPSWSSSAFYSAAFA